MDKTAVILCGGRGTRLGFLGKKTPKTLIKIQGKPILWYIINFLKNNNCESIIHYPTPPHLQNCYKEYSRLSLPITEKISQSVLSLPISPHHQLKEIDHICQLINSFK